MNDFPRAPPPRPSKSGIVVNSVSGCAQRCYTTATSRPHADINTCHTFARQIIGKRSTELVVGGGEGADLPRRADICINEVSISWSNAGGAPLSLHDAVRYKRKKMFCSSVLLQGPRVLYCARYHGMPGWPQEENVYRRQVRLNTPQSLS